MNGLDWVIVFILALSLITATLAGFLVESFALAGAVCGYALAAWEYPRIAPWFVPYVKSGAIADLAAFLAIFFVVLLLAGTAGRIARWAAKEAGLRWFDRLLGAAFGLVRGGVIVTVVVLAIVAFAPDSSALANSRFGGYFLVLAHGASWAGPSDVRQKVHDGAIAIRQAATSDRPQGTRTAPTHGAGTH